MKLDTEDRPWSEAVIYEPFEPDVDMEEASNHWVRAVFDGLGLDYVEAV